MEEWKTLTIPVVIYFVTFYGVKNIAKFFFGGGEVNLNCNATIQCDISLEKSI